MADEVLLLRPAVRNPKLFLAFLRFVFSCFYDMLFGDIVMKGGYSEACQFGHHLKDIATCE